MARWKLPKRPIEPKLLNLEEAATYLGRTPEAVRKLAARRHIPKIKVGARLQFDRADLDKYIAISKES